MAEEKKKPLSYYEKKRLTFIANIKRNQELKRLTDGEVALKAHMNKRSYQEKKNPNTDRKFTFPEIVHICQVLDFTSEQKAESL